MITAARSGCSFLASSSTCRPSMPGILRSTSRIDHGSALSISTAVGPSGAVASVYPSCSSHPDSDSRTISSSSTISIRVRSLLMVLFLSLYFLVTRPAVFAEQRGLGVNIENRHRSRHHALRPLAVNEAEGVAELVHALL